MSTEPGPADNGIPAWMWSVVTASRGLEARHLTRFTAPRGSSPRQASVLILFGGPAAGDGGPAAGDGDDEEETVDAHERGHVLLLERANDMSSHAGQVAFPGGRRDAEDADEVATALREAAEETGLEPRGVRVLGSLPPLWLPPSNFEVTPVLAWWHAPSRVHAVDAAETASVHVVGIGELLDPRNRATVRHPSGHRGPAFLVRGLVVWGFTAGLLARIFTVAGWDRPWDADRVVGLPPSAAPSALPELEQQQVEP